MRLASIVAGFALAMASTAALAEGAPAAPAAAAYTTAETNIGVLLDDPAAKEVIVKHLPGLAASPQIEMARGMTLKATQQFAPSMVTDEVLAKIDADLAKLPKK